MEMKQKICEYVERNKAVSFAELDQFIGENFRGTWAIESARRKNVIFWAGLSEEAIKSLNELVQEEKIHYDLTQSLTYVIDGCMIKYPIVKQDRDYKKPHWLPVVLNPGPKS